MTDTPNSGPNLDRGLPTLSVGDGFSICVLLVLLSVFFQKIALPGSNGILPVSFLGLAGISAAGILLGQLRVSVPTLACYLLFLFLASLSFAISTSGELSVASLGFFMVVQFPLMLRLRPGSFNYSRLLDYFNDLMVVLAIFGIVQFFLQFAIGQRAAFFLDTYSPAMFYLDNFNRLNELYYGAGYLKSNGFFMAEPSFLVQYLALGLVLEITGRARARRLAIYVAGIFVTFSGTGLMMLGAVLPWLLVRQSGFASLLYLILGIVGVMAAAEVAGYNLIADRATEFSQPGTSGYARFVSPFIYIGEWIFDDPVTLLLGRGPGSVNEYLDLLSYEAFDPSWAKIIYEYGLLGTAAYLLFFITAIRTCQPRVLVAPLIITYFVLGGYISNAFIVSLLAVFLSWTAEQREEGEEQPSS